MPNHQLVKRVMGSMDGVQRRIRQPKRRTDNITQWTGLSVGNVMKKTRSRALEIVFSVNGASP